MSKLDLADPEKTLALLWERIRQRGDLPGFTKAIKAVLGAMRGEEDLEFNMTQTVLSDPALTQKVLRLANSAMYSAFGQNISTVSKAVIVLGTETIGHLALGSRLVDELLSASTDSPHTHLEMEKALLAGQVAREVASAAHCLDPEEAVVCSMLHSLGRMMLTFYLPDHWAQVQQRCDSSGRTEDGVAHDMLGLTLEEAGRATAQRWGLPKSLVNTMREVKPQAVSDKMPHSDWLAALSTLSSRCASALCQDDSTGSVQIKQLASGYAAMLGVEISQVLGAVHSAQQASHASMSAVSNAKRVNTERRTQARAQLAEPKKDARTVLLEGLADMRGIASSASPSQMIAMGLETIYQGFNFTRAIAFLRNYKEAKYTAKLCFGVGVQELMPQLVFDDIYRPDVFHAALANDRVIFVEKAHDQKFAAKLPQWWKGTLSTARSFLILPLSVNSQPVGFMYGDWEDAMPGDKLDPEEFVILNDLRALVVQSAQRRR